MYNNTYILDGTNTFNVSFPNDGKKKKTKFLERLFESSDNYSKKIKIRCGIMAIEENKAFFPVNTPNNKL